MCRLFELQFFPVFTWNPTPSMFDLRSLPPQRTRSSRRTGAEAAALHRPLGRAINVPDAALLSCQCTRRAAAGVAALLS